MPPLKSLQHTKGRCLVYNAQVCGYLIDLLNESEINGDVLNDDGYLLRQMFPKNGHHSDFECDLEDLHDSIY